jgi:hypothetical protein
LRCVWGTNRQCTIFLAHVGPAQIPEKAHRDTLRQTSIFVPGGICRSRSALLCIWGVKHRRTILLARVGPLRIPQKCVVIPYTEHVFLHPVVSVGHVVHFGASGAWNIKALFSGSCGNGTDSTKSASRQVMSISRFCIPWDLRVT